jgi:hypothetical protein
MNESIVINGAFFNDLINTHMPRKGPRPHNWKMPGEIPHKQYNCWIKMRAQANYRKEVWLLSFEDYQQLWLGHWERKGRGNGEYCLTRDDPKGAWVIGNVECIPREDHLRRQKYYKTLKQG